MATIAERFSAFWDGVKGSPTLVKRSIPIPVDRVFDSGTFPNRLEPEKSYFKVVINEMFLTKAREWTESFDPMALVVSEFTYDGKRSTVPYVVGPSMLQNKMSEVPNGMSITDTQVAGVHKYVGGKFALTMILARVKRGSYAKRLLQVVESVSNAFPVGAALVPHLKVAGAVMGGIEELFGMGDTRSLVGHRWEYDDGPTPWLVPGFFVLINEDENTTRGRELSVVNGRLIEGPPKSGRAFREADFMLYSLCAIESRTDITEFSFDRNFQESVLRDAASPDEGGWERAKAGFATLYKDIVTSPDLTWQQAKVIRDKYKARLNEVREEIKNSGLLGEGESTKLRATYSVGAYNGEEANVRRQEVSEIHNILKMP